jgi:hypothetical protein
MWCPQMVPAEVRYLAYAGLMMQGCIAATFPCQVVKSGEHAIARMGKYFLLNQDHQICATFKVKE